MGAAYGCHCSGTVTDDAPPDPEPGIDESTISFADGPSMEDPLPDQDDEAPTFEIGMRVRIMGLRSASLTWVNGQTGKLAKKNEDGSWNVLLDKDEHGKQKTCKKMKVAYLEILEKAKPRKRSPNPRSRDGSGEHGSRDGSGEFGSRDRSGDSRAKRRNSKDEPRKNYDAKIDTAPQISKYSLPNRAEESVWATPAPKPKEESKPARKIPPDLQGVALQRFLGPQSKRGGSLQYQLDVLEGQAHAQDVFKGFADREEEHCGDWAVQYHSYTYSALLYELHAALAAILFGFPAQDSPLPRLQGYKFKDIPDIPTLKTSFRKRFSKDKRKDHHPEFRAVAVSTMCSLVAVGPEVSTPVVFIGGYKHSDDRVDFRQTLEDLLSDITSSPKQKTEVKKLAGKIIAIADSHNLDTSWYGGKSGFQRRGGHMLQIFIKRDLVDELSYASQPWGDIDADRDPISTWFDGDTDCSWGQARILARPNDFMQRDRVRMYVASNDVSFHKSRPAFQAELIALLKEWLPDDAARQAASRSLQEGPRKQ